MILPCSLTWYEVLVQSCAQVLRVSLLNAASVAKVFLTSDVIITEIPEPEPVGAGAGRRHGRHGRLLDSYMTGVCTRRLPESATARGLLCSMLHRAERTGSGCAVQIWRGQSFAHLLRAVSRKGEGLCSSIAGEGSVYGSMASSIGLSLSCSMMYACMSAGGAGLQVLGPDL